MQKVVPAILTADPADLRSKLASLKGQSKWMHIDIMDGKFVPNSSVNLFELGEADQIFHLEIHLMVKNPEQYLEDCNGAGAKRVIFHEEAGSDPNMVLLKMEEYGFQKGVAINPLTPASVVAPYIEKLDVALVMSVNPGSQGQEFIPAALAKIAELRKQRQDIVIGVDGGVNESNIREIFAAGADYVDVGSAIIKSEDPADSLRLLEGMAP